MNVISLSSLNLNTWKGRLSPELDITVKSRPTSTPHKLMLHLAYWWLFICFIARSFSARIVRSTVLIERLTMSRYDKLYLCTLFSLIECIALPSCFRKHHGTVGNMAHPLHTSVLPDHSHPMCLLRRHCVSPHLGAGQLGHARRTEGSTSLHGSANACPAVPPGDRQILAVRHEHLWDHEVTYA